MDGALGQHPQQALGPGRIAHRRGEGHPGTLLSQVSGGQEQIVRAGFHVHIQTVPAGLLDQCHTFGQGGVKEDSACPSALEQTQGAADGLKFDLGRTPFQEGLRILAPGAFQPAAVELQHGFILGVDQGRPAQPTDLTEGCQHLAIRQGSHLAARIGHEDLERCAAGLPQPFQL